MSYVQLEPVIVVLIFSSLVGWVGSKRKIGFWKSFILSCLATPLLGIIFTLFSKKVKSKKEQDIHNRKRYEDRSLPKMVFTRDYSVDDKCLFIKGDEYPVYTYNYERMMEYLKKGIIICN